MMNEKKEDFLTHSRKLTQAASQKNITYEQWAEEVLGGADCYGDETLRRAVRIFSMFFEKLSEETINSIEDQNLLKQIQEEKLELQKERKKIQTANLEYHANLRNDARGEMFNEQILEAIKSLPPINAKPFKRDGLKTSQTGVLCIADAHYGTEFELKGLFGETINTYSPEICQARFRLLAKKVVEDYDMLAYDNLIVYDLGDAIQGMLRMSDLTKLKTGVLDSAIQYAAFMAEWLVGLRDALQVPIKYKGCGGNHDELRLLQGKRTFDEENIMKVIVELVRLRLKGVDGITVDDFGEVQFETIGGVNVLAYHGEDSKDPLTEIEFWENYLNISVDCLILGHLHHKDERTAGYGLFGDRDVIHVPSLVGGDSFGKKCRKISHAGAKFMVFEEDSGKTWERTYWLN